MCAAAASAAAEMEEVADDVGPMLYLFPQKSEWACQNKRKSRREPEKTSASNEPLAVESDL